MSMGGGYASQGGGSSSGNLTFLALTDTPSSFSGEQNKFIKVNAEATKLEFVTLSGGGDMTKAIYDTDDNGIVDVSESIDGGDFS